MIITKEEQLMLLHGWVGKKDIPLNERYAFIDGAKAMMELVDKKLKAEREAHA